MAISTLRLISGKVSADKVKAWQDLANGTPNLVGTSKDRDDRAFAHVVDCVRSHQSGASTRDRNASTILDIVAQGKVQARMPAGVTVHVPELRRAIMSLKPRMVEAVLGSPQWLQVVAGRDPNDQEVAKTIREWSHFQMDQSSMAHHMDQAAMALLVHGVAGWATDYEFETKKTRRRVAKRGMAPSGEMEITYSIEEAEEVVSEGCCIDPIDSFDLILDHGVSCVDEMRWVGRRCGISDSEAREMVQNSDWNAAAVKEALESAKDQETSQAAPTNAGIPRTIRQQQVAMMSTNTRKSGGSGLHDLVELWCEFDLEGNGDYVETQIVTLNSKLVLLRRNPHWDEHRGIVCVTVPSDDGTLVGTSPAMLCVSLSAELDQLRACTLRTVMSAAAPFTISRGTNLTLPGSLWAVAPGTNFNAGSDPTADVKEIRITSAAGETSALERQIRMDIEEAMGAPRFWTGADTTGTATEIERRNEEARRSLLDKAQTLELLVQKTLRVFFELGRQYTSEPTGYRILGARAGDIQWGQITPEDFESPVDFILLGTAMADVYGMRGTRLMALINAAMPTLLQLYGSGDVDPRDVFRLLSDTMAGPEATNQILGPDETKLAMDPEDENELIGMGVNPRVSPLDDDEEHMAVHAPYKKSKDPKVAEAAARHEATHIIRQRQKQMEQARRERLATAAMQQAPGDGRLAPQEGRSGRSGGDYVRPPDMLGDTPNQTPPGETPGPPAMSRMAAADRSPAVPQVGNR